MSAPSMKAIKCQYFTDPVTNLKYYDITNDYETDPLEVIKSKLIFRLGTYKGEWFQDLDFGLPILAIKNNSTSPDTIAQLIADEILKVENVTSAQIVDKTFDASTRIFSASYNVNTIFGTTTVEVNV